MPSLSRGMHSRRATLIGFSAVLMWAALALLSAASGKMPPFQLAAVTFLIGSIPGFLTRWRNPNPAPLPRNWRVWVLGVGGLFGYHFVYFTAMRAAPAVEVSLIAYLWPLLIVVFSGLLPGEKLRLHHMAGVLLGFAGAAMIISKGGTIWPNQLEVGHVLALACAFIWAGYSVLSRQFGEVATEVVGVFCFITALLSLICHLIFETSIWPANEAEWAAVVALGIFPVGLAFYAWDYGVKHGDIMVLGAASYSSPLLSTLVLAAAGLASFNLAVGAACLLITAGALLAAKDMLFQRK
jgi:drug/metabolite transporter (DMT)-like permease